MKISAEAEKSQATASVSQFFKLIAKHKPASILIAAAIVLGLGETLLSLLIPLLTKNLVDELSQSTIQKATFVVLGAVFLAQTIMSGFTVYTMSYVGQHVIAGLRREVWERVLRLPVPFFDRNSSGETMSRVTNDTNVIKDFIIGHVISFLGGIISIIGGVTLLLMIDWKLTLLMLIAVPAALLVLWPLGTKMFTVSKSMQDETALFQGDLGRVLSDIRLVKASLAEPVELRQGSLRISRLFTFGLQEARIMSVVTPLMMTVMLLILVILIGYGGVRVAQGTLTGGELVAIILYMFQIVMPFTQMASFFTQFQKAMGASERILELLGEKDEQHGEAVLTANEQATVQTSLIQFDRVSFGYSEDRPLLHAVSFHARQGQVTAFVGPSGTGKTTLFSLLERFYNPTQGEITYAGEPIASMRLEDWRKRIAYVSQDSPMMQGTIRHNLTYGLEQVEEERINEAVKQANLTSFIHSLPNGYETEVGERGVMLSGGQRQRLAIARAILRNPDILLLDEATAHLDSDSEQQVQEALHGLMKGRTTLVIAHRLSTIRGANQIIVLEKGGISGQGSHAELLGSHPLYAKLVQQQFSVQH
ncbi:ABC transporter ATP-binding protein [Paenibacillus sp. PL91]|uniref:ABC transporter ATP-binding protein n=1 Tax=Paenibacillus sp. PL91 TaxID=2729538 RepID=UPI00145E84C9|nr:ABC transporter ATP-binding protein [Paenibacillus sp. PL91]MBC9203491.1 ABC transporter ATP-binding protein [Paenibacillus sp. PL91]